MKAGKRDEVEKVAKAIRFAILAASESVRTIPSWSGVDDHGKRHFRNIARAAIRALRPPARKAGKR